VTGRVLLAGFEAFGKAPVNPSAEIARLLAGSKIAGHEIFSAVLPVEGARVGSGLERALGESSPDLALALGLAPGRSVPAVERVAINVVDFPVPDNGGWQATGEPIDPGGPAAYFGTLPLKAIIAAWRARGLPGYVSNTAGTFLCNQAFYLLGRWAARSEKAFGLIHLPWDLAGACRSEAAIPPPALPLEILKAYVSIAVEVALDHAGPDVALAAGALC